MKKLLYITLIAIFTTTCGSEEEVVEEAKVPETTNEVKAIKTPNFNSDSAYLYIQQQVDFGPRVPNSPEHAACAEFLKGKLSQFGAKLIVQEGVVKTFDGTQLNIQNIIGQFNPQAKNRVLLCAHWDTRPFADKDTKNISKPIDGANDGASGVGVLLEIARQLSLSQPLNGIDIIFFDAEDYGTIEGTNIMQLSDLDDTWCLGSQYWAKNPPIKNYKAKYGILLDMVGAKDAVFPKEQFSMYYAKDQVFKIWKTAQKMGYSKYFVNHLIGGITDDHKYINEWAKIPCVDIIHYEPNNNSFGSFHHTHQDNMEVIDKNTLKAVGQTVLEVIYQGI